MSPCNSYLYFSQDDFEGEMKNIHKRFVTSSKEVVLITYWLIYFFQSKGQLKWKQKRGKDSKRKLTSQKPLNGYKLTNDKSSESLLRWI